MSEISELKSEGAAAVRGRDDGLQRCTKDKSKLTLHMYPSVCYRLQSVRGCSDDEAHASSEVTSHTHTWVYCACACLRSQPPVSIGRRWVRWRQQTELGAADEFKF